MYPSDILCTNLRSLHMCSCYRSKSLIGRKTCNCAGTSSFYCLNMRLERKKMYFCMNFYEVIK